MPAVTNSTSWTAIRRRVSDKDEPFRVLFYQFFPGGGIGRYTHELVSRMALDERVRPEVVCLPSYQWREGASYPVWTGLREIGHASPWRRRARFLAAQFANPRRLAVRVRQTSAKIVHFSNFNHLTFPLWRRAIERAGAKAVATVHDVRRASPILNRTFETKQLRHFYRWCDALFVHSRFQAEELAQFAQVPPDRIHVVPHGPYDYGPADGDRSTLRDRYGVPQDRTVALFFGGIRDEKNLYQLLQAIPRAESAVHLVVAGRGGAKGHRKIDAYRQLVDTLGVGDRVSFMHRFIPDEEVAALFAMSDFAALPYSRQFTSQSGVLNVALQHRCPVLISDAPTFAEALEGLSVGRSVRADDIESLAQGIDLLVGDLRRQQPFDFDAYLRRYSWQANVYRTVAVYAALLGDMPVTQRQLVGEEGGGD